MNIRLRSLRAPWRPLLARAERGKQSCTASERNFFWRSIHQMLEKLCINLENSIAVACGQSAKSFELRAATSLAELWRMQGKSNEVRALLEPVSRLFEEGRHG